MFLIERIRERGLLKRGLLKRGTDQIEEIEQLERVERIGLIEDLELEIEGVVWIRILLQVRFR